MRIHAALQLSQCYVACTQAIASMRTITGEGGNTEGTSRLGAIRDNSEFSRSLCDIGFIVPCDLGSPVISLMFRQSAKIKCVFSVFTAILSRFFTVFS
jgi:hypothetical protein